VNGPFRTIAMVSGVLLVVASAIMIVAALRSPQRIPRAVVAQATGTPSAAPTASPAPRATVTPTAAPTPSPAPHAPYTPLRPVEVRTFHPSPAPTASPSPSGSPSPAPTHSPTASPAPSPTPQPPRSTPSANPGPLVGGPDDDACLRTLSYLKTAADDRLTRREIYNAANAGLAMNAHCGEPRRSVNEAYLLAMRAPAAFSLHVGDWNADLTRSDALLDACSALPEFRATTVAGDCATQRKFNDLVRRRIIQLGGRRATSASR
jgi:hypothetical protein